MHSTELCFFYQLFLCSSKTAWSEEAVSMDAIKKKMQAMKVEKDNAMDRSDTCEEAARVAKVNSLVVARIISWYGGQGKQFTAGQHGQSTVNSS